MPFVHATLIDSIESHRAMFKIGAKQLFSLCLLVKNVPAVYSADRSNFWESETDCSRNGNNLYKSWVERALNSGPFGHLRFANHHCNWQILIKVWASVICLSCLVRTILEYEKVRQIWTLLFGRTLKDLQKSRIYTIMSPTPYIRTFLMGFK